ncbi:YqcC family protein [Algicola sagamiensis]|uniref:YqcC family protein n=1 Tax=Algicola sagamiensis TaxID=163869 RepID=UPI000366A3D9|nr:YqcC family protein [Algicola sagamiensis]
MSKVERTRELLIALEHAMKEANLWQTEQPPLEALNSQQPFCCDTLDFEQWLEFIFIPRMHALLDGHLPLPENIAVCPMAEEALKGPSAIKVIDILADIDELLSGKRTRS